MSNFENQLEVLSDIIFEDEDFSKAEAMVKEMIEADYQNLELGEFSEFLSLASDAIEDKEDSTTFNMVTKWALTKYNREKNKNIISALKYADLITTWLNHKLELVEEPANAKESEMALRLFTDIVENSAHDKPADESTNDYQGYATYSLLVGISKREHALIDNAIDAQRKVLGLYQKGQFPDYYNVATFVAGAKRSLASTLMEAYEFDNRRYLQYCDEIGDLLKCAVKEFESCGTDFDKEYTSTLLSKYVGYER
jgi:hypothetical protein